MKKICQSVFVIFISGLGLFSCQSIPETVIPSNLPPVNLTVSSINPFLVATLNNSSWTATTETAHYNSSDSTVTLSGSNSAGSIYIVFNVKQSSTSVDTAYASIGGTLYPYSIVNDFKVNSSPNQVTSAVSGTFDITFYNTTATTGTGVSLAVFKSGSFIVKPN